MSITTTNDQYPNSVFSQVIDLEVTPCVITDFTAESSFEEQLYILGETKIELDVPFIPQVPACNYTYSFEILNIDADTGVALDTTVTSIVSLTN